MRGETHTQRGGGEHVRRTLSRSDSFSVSLGHGTFIQPRRTSCNCPVPPSPGYSVTGEHGSPRSSLPVKGQHKLLIDFNAIKTGRCLLIGNT